MSELALVVFWLPFLAGIVVLLIVGLLAMRQDRLGGGLVVGAGVILVLRTVLVYVADIASFVLPARVDLDGELWGVPVGVWWIGLIAITATVAPLGRALAWFVLGLGLWRLSRGAVARWREQGAMTSE